MTCVSASKLQTIPDSAAHQILEARWLRNPQFVKDTIQLYTRAGCEVQSYITYTHYVQRAVLETIQALGDRNFLVSQLAGLELMFNLWNTTLDPTTGLYHRTPLLDAQEYSLPNFIVGGPDGGPVVDWNDPGNDFNLIWLGPETYRPNFNAYMIANAAAISDVAQLAGLTEDSADWNLQSEAILANMESTLWDEELQFWIDVVQGSNLPIQGRELIGLFPYRFDIGTNDTYLKGIEASMTSKYFVSEYGPTTLSQTNPYFTALKNITYCCVRLTRIFTTLIARQITDTTFSSGKGKVGLSLPRCISAP